MLAFGTSLIFISQVVSVRNNTNSKQSSKGNPHKFQNDAVSIKKKGWYISKSTDQHHHASTAEG